MTIKLKPLLITSVIILLIITSLIGYIYKLKSEILAKDETIAISNQNINALLDKQAMKDSIIQDYAVMVKNLQSSNSEKDKKIYLLNSKYSLIFDSLIILNKIVDSVYNDTTKIIIPFKGKEGKVNYRGNTVFYKIEKVATYSIWITVDSIKIINQVYWDKKDSLIKNRLFADSVLIGDAETYIDEELYKLIRNKQVICPEISSGFFDMLSLYGDISTKISPQYVVKINDINFGMRYDTESISMAIFKSSLTPYFGASLQYKVSFNRIWKFIF